MENLGKITYIANQKHMGSKQIEHSREKFLILEENILIKAQKEKKLKIEKERKQ